MTQPSGPELRISKGRDHRTQPEAETKQRGSWLEGGPCGPPSHGWEVEKHGSGPARPGFDSGLLTLLARRPLGNHPTSLSLGFPTRMIG